MREESVCDWIRTVVSSESCRMASDSGRVRRVETACWTCPWRRRFWNNWGSEERKGVP